MAFAEDLSVFFRTQDFAVEATVGVETAAVLLDAPAEAVLGGMGISNGYLMSYPASAFVALKHGDAVSIAGVSYTVRSIVEFDNAGISQATLSRT